MSAAPALLAALKRIAAPHACGCLPCTGQCLSQESLQITVDAMRDLAEAAIAAWNRHPAPAPGLEEAVEAARRIIDWVELTGEGPSDAWPTTCGDAIAIARALLALTRGDGRELGASAQVPRPLASK